ncbi:FecR family protein [Parachryseolinea silvisoli]|uniref:FecR family protein n=1 Tax=Parachryseolinea silvisoli TaxID=2873601 RepID=UPI002265E5E0|nr:FecR domain-containing protein [Parachryseolinea silvisoli]MCD9014442.1 FecR domain-containing protein [Parachryseolinea silvisoli]
MPKNLETLLKRWKQGEITNKELAILKDMLHSQKHQGEYLEILEGMEGSDQFSAEADKSYEKTYQSLVAQIDSTERNHNFKLTRVAAVAASIALVLAVTLWSLRSTQLLVDYHDIAKVEFTGKQYIKLPDGTAVILNDSSYLVYDSGSFGAATREVRLIGEAYFDVAHNSERPFIVHTQEVSTTVLGTAFNIKALNQKSEIVVTVTRGQVRVGNTEKVFDYLLPDESLTINSQTFSYSKHSVQAENVVAWKSSMLIMDNVSMLDAAKILSEHFNTKIKISESLDSCRVTAYFTKGESLEQVLDIISLSKNGNYEMKKGSASIAGTCE